MITRLRLLKSAMITWHTVRNRNILEIPMRLVALILFRCRGRDPFFTSMMNILSGLVVAIIKTGRLTEEFKQVSLPWRNTSTWETRVLQILH